MYTFFLLMFGHYLADYPLQGLFVATEKSHLNKTPLAPWKQVLTAHAWIHGGFVTLFTGSLVLGVMETVVHGYIDYTKCSKKLSYDEDQTLHYACKVLWVFLLWLCPSILMIHHTPFN